jgi:hypothetical protein
MPWPWRRRRNQPAGPAGEPEPALRGPERAYCQVVIATRAGEIGFLLRDPAAWAAAIAAQLPEPGRRTPR